MGEDDGFDDADDPALAFARVEDRLASVHGEVALLRAAIEGLTAARENIEIPDYEPTLGRTEKVLGILVQQIDGVRKSPAMTLTPENMGSRLNASVAEATRELQHQVQSAKSALSSATFDLQNMVASARRGDVQNRWLIGTGLGGAALGMLLYAAFASPVARMMPANWHWPEQRAMHALGEPTMWDAGQRLMQTAAPESWGLIVAAAPLADGNREAVQACREKADKAKKPVRCTIEIKPIAATPQNDSRPRD